MAWLAPLSQAADDPFVIRGAPTPRAEERIRKAAHRARERLQKRWPKSLSDEALELVWFASPRDFEAATGRRPEGVMALASKRLDRVILNGQAISSAGPGAIETTLLHEMVHIHFGRAGVERLPRWLEEGLAMRLSDETALLDGWHMASDRLFGRVGHADDLWGAWPETPELQSRAYRQAASLTDFLIERRFPEHGKEEGERRMLKLLLDPRRADDYIDTLWRPAVRASLYSDWANQGGRVGAFIIVFSGPTVLLGLVGSGLLLLAYRVKRKRAGVIADEWEEEGPYFSDPDDPEEYDEEDDYDYDDGYEDEYDNGYDYDDEYEDEYEWVDDWEDDDGEYRR